MNHPDFEDLLNEQTTAERPRGLLKQGKTESLQEETKVQDLKSIDLEQELLKQYQRAQTMLEEGYDEPLNQRAQTLNSITNILQAIIKSQQELYSIDRLKTLENTLIKTLQDFPEIKHKFIAAYEKELKKL